MNVNSEIDALAQETFAHLAERGNLSGAYTKTRSWFKNDKRRLHIVQRYDAKDHAPVILKQVFRPEDPTEFNGILDAHHLASQALQACSEQHAPEILVEDRALKACLMRFQPGETLRDLCETHEDHADILMQTGRWLSAYHRGTFEQARGFQPKFMARHMLHLADQMQTGARRIKGQKRFVALAHQVQDMVADYEGRPSKIAAKHGDFNSHNILIEGNRTAGFDFLPISHAPVGYDIARILLSYALTAVDLDRIPKGHVLPPEALAAFFEGYDFVPADDPSVGFLLRIQILSDWNRMSDKKGVQNLINFERLRVIARRAFA
ncbi:aminoglycoside phosphotransferase family protein [Shimia sp. R11_0]|uniref:phosphotransferase n=1 Tax=Shimia sp. R11_0 TaxID=2821096 RepID=UPI001ADA2DF5|nr:aminoglycoside phosphotransferase family protein [Shimia sp. R11_0]